MDDTVRLPHMTRCTIAASAFLLAVPGALTGCVSGIGMERFDALMMEKVRTKAAFDFQCSKDQLVVSKIDNGAYGAVGCGKRGTYVGKDSGICVQFNTEDNLNLYCQVVPDTYSLEESPPPPQ